jgi:hypothetical protein
LAVRIRIQSFTGVDLLDSGGDVGLEAHSVEHVTTFGGEDFVIVVGWRRAHENWRSGSSKSSAITTSASVAVDIDDGGSEGS